MDHTAERVLPRERIQVDWAIVGWVLAIKSFILLFGALAYQAFADRRLESTRGLLEIWNRWDAPHYLDLAQYGYHATDVGEIRLFIVFYPLFPWLTRIAGLLVNDMLVGAFIVSTFASIATALLLERLVALDEPPAIARQAVWFLLIFPTSYFLHIGYTESVFMAGLLGCFLAARKGQWWLAGGLGALASLARVNGLVLIPALLAEAWWQYRATRRWDWGWLWIGAVALGFGGYLLLNYSVSGDPLAFLQIQREHWYKSLTWPWLGISETIRSTVWRPPSEAHMLGIQELIYIVIGLVCTILTCVTMRPSYSVWMVGNWLLCTSTSFIMSMPRYILIMFPMYILFARAARDQRWRMAITVWSLMFMGMFISLFVQGRWAF